MRGCGNPSAPLGAPPFAQGRLCASALAKAIWGKWFLQKRKGPLSASPRLCHPPLLGGWFRRNRERFCRRKRPCPPPWGGWFRRNRKRFCRRRRPCPPPFGRVVPKEPEAALPSPLGRVPPEGAGEVTAGTRPSHEGRVPLVRLEIKCTDKAGISQSEWRQTQLSEKLRPALPCCPWQYQRHHLHRWC